MKNGKVKIFFKEKGYGFIYADEKDYYFHITNVKGAELPDSGDIVSFEETVSDKGDAALNVTIVSQAGNNVLCEYCGRRMVPRLIIEKGTPSYSVCPFCGKKYKVFTNFVVRLSVFALIFFIIMYIFFEKFGFGSLILKFLNNQ